MREDEAGRPRVSWRRRLWFKPISTAVASVSAAILLAIDAASGLAARKNKGRDEDRGGNQSDKDRDRGGDRDRDSNSENDRKGDGKPERENNDKAGRDGDGDGRNNDRGRKQERQDDDATDVDAAASKQQKANRSQETEQTTDDPEDTEDPEDPEDTGGGGRGGRGDGGGNDAGNAGSGLFDSPLATKARRRAKDFENADREDDDDGIIVDINPEGESVYETDTILFASGPEGAEIVTDNITFFAAPAPPPEPLPRIELPVREPGFPFGEDFPFGDTAVITGPTAEPEPTDPGDTAPAPAPPAEPVPASDEPAPASSDGGDNTMDFSS